MQLSGRTHSCCARLVTGREGSSISCMEFTSKALNISSIVNTLKDQLRKHTYLQFTKQLVASERWCTTACLPPVSSCWFFLLLLEGAVRRTLSAILVSYQPLCRSAVPQVTVMLRNEQPGNHPKAFTKNVVEQLYLFLWNVCGTLCIVGVFSQNYE